MTLLLLPPKIFSHRLYIIFASLISHAFSSLSIARSLFTTTSCLPSSRATFASLLPNPLFNGQKWSSGRWNAEQSTTISITMFVDDCAVKRCGYVNLGMRYMMWGKLFERKGM
uniref:Uncharacterized protein n=1 Tax=Meloidogyne floridensis TaxID=298350 RepID=A0A915P7M0_9BILA